MTMEIAPITDEQALWKQRFCLHHTVGYIARCNSHLGLVISNQSNIYQLYAWDIPCGTLRQLTKNSSGQAAGELSSDGRFVYYLHTEHGKNIGHFIQLDTDTGKQVDLIPNSSLYAGRGITSDWTNTTICYITTDDINGMQLFTQSITISSGNVPKQIYQTFDATTSSTISCSGDIVVIQTTSYTAGLQCNLLAFDTNNGGQQLRTFGDDIGITIGPKQFAPLPGDTRLLATSDRNHVNRPFIWNLRTGVKKIKSVQNTPRKVRM